MRVLNIDHINIAGPTVLLAACRAFYVEIIGLQEGDRPPFSSRGFWLYAGESPVVHLTEKSGYLVGGTSPLDHFAFNCEGLAEILERLKNHQIAHSITEVPGSSATQVFIKDPAGIALELNFPSA